MLDPLLQWHQKTTLALWKCHQVPKGKPVVQHDLLRTLSGRNCFSELGSQESFQGFSGKRHWESDLNIKESHGTQWKEQGLREMEFWDRRKGSWAGQEVDLKTCWGSLGERTGRSSDVSGPWIPQHILSFNPEFNIWELFAPFYKSKRDSRVDVTYPRMSYSLGPLAGEHSESRFPSFWRTWHVDSHWLRPCLTASSLCSRPSISVEPPSAFLGGQSPLWGHWPYSATPGTAYICS